jgi:hypothetical protein
MSAATGLPKYPGRQWGHVPIRENTALENALCWVAYHFVIGPPFLVVVAIKGIIESYRGNK